MFQSLGIGMIARGLWFCGFAGLALLAALGCGTKKPPLPEPDKYPVRADWLVVTVPSSSGQPSKWYEPGYPPLLMLDRPFDTLGGDDALLAGQVRNRVILNTSSRMIVDSRGKQPTESRVEEEIRDEFAKVLTERFGTPIEPRVPSGEMLVAYLKLDEKLKTVEKNLADKEKEFATFQTNAKGPDDQPVLNLLIDQVKAATKEVAKASDQIEHLQAYESELKLDQSTLKTGGVLFRSYCQQCHGLTGDGNGPGGKYLIPLPRDYRAGLFKFITTDPSLGTKRKPRREDLYRTITKGLDGSPMPQFAALKEGEIQALISYVIHLSMRGEAEYEVMKKAADPGGDGMTPEEVRKGLLQQSGTIAPLWIASARKPLVPDPNPYSTELQVLDSAANGHKLFTSAAVACTTCHTGYGRSSPFQFDAWGSITRPRNLTVATLRGGRKPEEIYARIYGGILGVNMPEHSHLRPTQEDKEKGVDKIWDLVNFVIYAAESEKRQILKERYQIEMEP